MIVGTAGHIDHGKTALIKALTGVDTDRLKEEKARGITIDLGFAYLPAPDGSVIGFVDVPGHERFVHTMVAGATGIDFALLAIAADDGCKPQTWEHVAILDLLGVRRGIVALTKCDNAASERIAAVSDEITQLLDDTSLATAEIHPVSALTGAGMAALRDRLFRAADELMPRVADGAFRLAIDRCFIIAGAGVIVTGTVLSGTVRVGDRVVISPAGLTARVRSLHVQDRLSDMGKAGERCALNLAGEEISKNSIRRGDVVVDPALHAPTVRIDAQLRLLPGERKPVGQWFPVRLHHAATEIGARILPLGAERIVPGATATAQLVLERPIAAAQGDSFIIRDVSAQRTLGGGQFLDLRAPARKRRTPERLLQLQALIIPDPAASLRALLSVPPHYGDWRAFARDRALSSMRKDEIISVLGLVLLESDGIALLPLHWNEFLVALLEGLASFHAGNPDIQGMGREQLRLSLMPRLPTPSFIAVLQILAREGHVALDGAFIRLASHTVRLTEKDELLWVEVAALLDGEYRYRPPRTRDIAQTLDLPEADIRRLLKLAAVSDAWMKSPMIISSYGRQFARWRPSPPNYRKPRRTGCSRPRNSATDWTMAARSRSRFSISSTVMA